MPILEEITALADKLSPSEKTVTCGIGSDLTKMKKSSRRRLISKWR